MWRSQVLVAKRKRYTSSLTSLVAGFLAECAGHARGILTWSSRLQSTKTSDLPAIHITSPASACSGSPEVRAPPFSATFSWSNRGPVHRFEWVMSIDKDCFESQPWARVKGDLRAKWVSGGLGGGVKCEVEFKAGGEIQCKAGENLKKWRAETLQNLCYLERLWCKWCKFLRRWCRWCICFSKGFFSNTVEGGLWSKHCSTWRKLATSFVCLA